MKYNGFTAYIVFGRYAGWHIYTHRSSIRVVCGWVAVAVCFFDLEIVIENLIRRPPRP
jgi:hypothetical protein